MYEVHFDVVCKSELSNAYYFVQWEDDTPKSIFKRNNSCWRIMNILIQHYCLLN